MSIPGWLLWNQGNGVEEQIRVGLKGESEEHFFFLLGRSILGRGRRVLLLRVFGEIFCRGFIG